MDACYTPDFMRVEVEAKLACLTQQLVHLKAAEAERKAAHERAAEERYDATEEVAVCAKFVVALSWVEHLATHLGSEWEVRVGYGDYPPNAMFDVTLDHIPTAERWLGQHDAGTLSFYDTCVDYVDGKAASDYAVMRADTAAEAARHLRSYLDDRMPNKPRSKEAL
jgi:hypothetical protein